MKTTMIKMKNTLSLLVKGRLNISAQVREFEGASMEPIHNGTQQEERLGNKGCQWAVGLPTGPK